MMGLFSFISISLKIKQKRENKRKEKRKELQTCCIIFKLDHNAELRFSSRLFKRWIQDNTGNAEHLQHAHQ